MKNLKALALMVLALIAGIGAALFAAGAANQGRAASGKVVVAAIDVEPGSRLKPEMLSVIEWPSAFTPDGVFTEPAQLNDRVVRSGLVRGEALVERKLMPAGAQGGLSAVIAEGKRAMTVRVNEVVGVAGFALPGNYVDVMVNAQQDRGTGQQPVPVSVTVLENVLVLAVAQEASRDDSRPKVVSAVTLELSPQDAEKLDLARSVGTLSLVLRNQLDKAQAGSAGISKDALFKALQPVAAPVPVAAKPAEAARPAARKPVVAAPAREAAREPGGRDTCVEVIRAGTGALRCF
jgi:pilus assembly protein CpaB